jgi:hypothetical protein
LPTALLLLVAPVRAFDMGGDECFRVVVVTTDEEVEFEPDGA